MNKAFKYIACCLVGVFTLLPMQAQNIIRPKIAGPGNLWVNSYNGVLFFGQTDFETQNSAMPMQLRFYYNSSASDVNYGYGLGFSLGYEMRYREDVIGGVDIETGDGRTDHFAKYGDEYKAPVGVFSTLIRPTYNTYLLTTKEGEKYYFDNAYHQKVTAIEDRYGNKTTFKYQDTLLIEIKDAVGHTITLSYADGLMTQASVSFSPGVFKYEYDGLRRLRKRIDPLGNVTLYDYSRQNKINEITDANGNSTFIVYNNSGMVSRLKTDVSDKSIRYDGDKTIFIDYTEPKNVYSYYRWDDKGRTIEKVGLCCGIQSSLKYDDNDNIAQRTDANGNSTTYTYDERGNVLLIKDPIGNLEQYAYEPLFNQIVSYSDKNGNNYTFTYDTKGNLMTISGPLGFNFNFDYDVHGWQTKVIDSNGATTRTSYNSDGTISEILKADGGIVNYTYDSYGRKISQTDAMGFCTNFSYDDLGRLIVETDALGNSIINSYDKVGNLVRIKDAAGQITSYTYDALGNTTSVTNPMGGCTTYEYDGRGNTIAVIDPLGLRTAITYNEINKIESYANGAGEKTYFDYDANGNLIGIEKPNGNIFSCDFDQLNRLTEISDNMGLIANFEYDGNGNIVSISDGLDRKVTYTFDGLNRQMSEKLPSGSQMKYEYDGNGNLISSTDALGHVSNFTYDLMNRKISETDALSAKTSYNYDANGNLVRITDANGNTTTYSYDALNRNTVITFANGRSLQYTYDELGRIINFKNRAGNEIKYDYNSVGNLISKIYPNGSSNTYSYDAIGRMISAKNKDAFITFSYDEAGRLLNETLNGKTTSYLYDVAAGNRKITYPSGMNISFHLNARELISNIFQNGKEVVAISYNTAGQKISQSYGNGITTSYSYDENAWLKSIKADHNIMSFEMDYDANGNIIQRRDLLNNFALESYDYDAISQIISFTRGSSLSKSYQFDLVGNRTQILENGIASKYNSNNVNSYTRITGNTNYNFQYDENGSIINDEIHTYTYDFDNKLIGVDNDGCVFKYDALGRRIQKNNTLFYYAGNQMIEEVTDGVATSYLFGNNVDEVLQMTKDNNKYYYHGNHLGSIMALSDSIGNSIETIEYDIYGKPDFYDKLGNEIEQSSIGNNILFTGREYDSEVGIYYYRSRYLHPIIGRFIQKDSLLFIDGLNDYSYVNNRPVMKVDPNGTNPVLIVAGVLGGVAIIAGIGGYYEASSHNSQYCDAYSGELGGIIAAGLIGAAVGSIGGPLGSWMVGLAAGGGYAVGYQLGKH